MTTNEMKLNELKVMVRAWIKTKSVRTAADICEFLADNLDLEGDDENAQ